MTDSVIMNELQEIQQRIFSIRGERVMLDRDLAEMYGVETRVLNQAVRRNSDRFPADFMFQLTDSEVELWKSQIVMSNSVKMGLRRRPYAFTELGVAMLSSILKSHTAIQINIGIMRAFVAVRQALAAPVSENYIELKGDLRKLKEYIEDVLTDQNEINEDTTMRLELIEQSLAELQASKRLPQESRPKIGFNI